MTDYISREAMINLVEDDGHANEIDLGWPDGNMAFVEMIKELPAADVRPVVRGKWIPVGLDDVDEGMFKCSECGSEHFFPEILMGIHADNFCPNCGADMREET
jgi:hypothetical protein